MTTPEPPTSQPQPAAPPEPKDRVYRSPTGLLGGVLLIALTCWLGFDAVVVGSGRTPWTALATMLFLIPLIVAYTLRPAVFANENRLRVRNPFRVIVLPWGQVAALRSGYSNEVFSQSDTKYQLWAIPVSLRARNRVARQESRRKAREARRRGAGSAPAAADTGPVRTQADRSMGELRDLLEARGNAGASAGEVTIRWAYEIIAPALVGGVAMVVLLSLG